MLQQRVKARKRGEQPDRAMLFVVSPGTCDDVIVYDVSRCNTEFSTIKGTDDVAQLIKLVVCSIMRVKWGRCRLGLVGRSKSVALARPAKQVLSTWTPFTRRVKALARRKQL